MNMIGVGPFITLPLVVASLGAGAWLGWLAGALLALCDGLVWAELGAALPRAGGSYAFLREIYKPGPQAKQGGFDWGRFLSFLYVWQLLFTAPLSMASGALGLAQYASYLAPGLLRGVGLGPVTLKFSSLLAAGVCCLVILLLYSGVSSITRTAGVLTIGVFVTMGAVIGVGFFHAAPHLLAAQFHWPHPGGGLAPALGAAALVTTYDYWGYYNVCFLGGSVRNPGRSIPRVVLLSVFAVGALYLLMNGAILAAMPVSVVTAHKGSLEPVAAVLMRSLLPGALGKIAGVAIAVMIIWTAFASVVALLLGYSQAPFAAARDGNFFSLFARTHPCYGFPQAALLVLGAIAIVFCFFDLRTVISALVAVRIVLQYGMQQVGVILLRHRQPDLPRPFRMPLFPLPPLAALGGFGFLLFERPGATRELSFAAILAISGLLLFLWRERTRVHE